jgi:2-polyprenyl-6-methoxyphenol hydroxylase-like FAD-dependent oxidoreductase
VGDAAYFKDPLTAHGISDALRDAELLAGAVAKGSDEALAGYETSRDDLSLGLFDLTDQIASFQWDNARLKALHEALAGEMKREVVALARMHEGAAVERPRGGPEGLGGTEARGG